MPTRAEAIFETIRLQHPGDLKAPIVGALLAELFQETLNYLNDKERVDLHSLVEEKQYFAFDNGAYLSRAINVDLYHPSMEEWNLFTSSLQSGGIPSVASGLITRAVYCVAISFCALIDLTSRGNQKTPGTFFEYLIGHLFASRLNCNPRTRLPVLNIDMDTTLPTDFVFDLGSGRPKFHLPIKKPQPEKESFKYGLINASSMESMGQGDLLAHQ